MVTKFTADVTGRDPTQLPCRLHGRYYDFALPTLVLLFLAQTTPNSQQPRSAPFKIIVISGALASSALGYSSALNYCPTFVDFPDLSGIVPDRLHIGFLISGCLGSRSMLGVFYPESGQGILLRFHWGRSVGGINRSIPGYSARRW